MRYRGNGVGHTGQIPIINAASNNLTEGESTVQDEEDVEFEGEVGAETLPGRGPGVGDPANNHNGDSRISDDELEGDGEDGVGDESLDDSGSSEGEADLGAEDKENEDDGYSSFGDL